MTTSLTYLVVSLTLFVANAIAFLYARRPGLFPVFPTLTPPKRNAITVGISYALFSTFGIANVVELAFQPTVDKRIWLFIGIIIVSNILVGMVIREIWPSRHSDAKRLGT